MTAGGVGDGVHQGNQPSADAAAAFFINAAHKGFGMVQHIQISVDLVLLNLYFQRSGSVADGCLH